MSSGRSRSSRGRRGGGGGREYSRRYDDRDGYRGGGGGRGGRGAYRLVDVAISLNIRLLFYTLFSQVTKFVQPRGVILLFFLVEIF